MNKHPLRLSRVAIVFVVLILCATGVVIEAQQKDPAGTRSGGLSDAFPAPKPEKKVSAVSAMRGRRPGKTVRQQFYQADLNFPQALPSGGRSLATIGVTIVRGRVATEAEILDRTIATVQGCVKWTDDKCVERKSMVLARILDDTPVFDGDQIQMTIEFLSFLTSSGQQVNRIAYLYVINREQYPDGSWGETKLLFPTLQTYGGDNRVLPGKTVTLPAPNRPWTISRSVSGKPHAFETYTLIVSPQPLTDLAGRKLSLKDRAIKLDEALVDSWIRKWGGKESRGVLENGVGQLITQREIDASGTMERKERGTHDEADDLSLDDPAPQVVFRKIVTPRDKLLVTVKLPFKMTRPANSEPTSRSK